MVRLTILARALDGLPLCASTEPSKHDEELLAQYHKQAKALLRRIAPSANPLPTKASVRSDPYCFHYIVEMGVCFLVLCEKTYPRLLAFSYLMELQREFFEMFTHSDVQSAMRPYEFLRFEPFLEKTRRRYLNTRTLRTPHNLAELSERLQFLQIFTAKDVLGSDYQPISAALMSRVADGGGSSGSGGSGSGGSPRNTGTASKLHIVAFAGVSILAAIVSLFKDLIPSASALAVASSVSELQNTPDVLPSDASLEWVTQISSIMTVYLWMQAVLILRGSAYVRWVILVSAVMASVMVLARLFVWVTEDVPANETLLSMIGALSPYLALIMLTVSHLLTVGPGARSIKDRANGLHSD